MGKKKLLFSSLNKSLLTNWMYVEINVNGLHEGPRPIEEVPSMGLFLREPKMHSHHNCLKPLNSNQI